MPPVRTYAVINQKGGVGKTTTVANLGAALASRGRDVCLIDLDPQAHLTLHFGVEPDTPAVSMYDVLTADTALSAAISQIAPRLSLAPAVIDLAAAEVELVTTVGREQILRDRLRDNPPAAELVLIDCPPSLGLLTLNALAAADEVLIPLQPHFLALQGLGKLLETIALVQRRINPRLRVAGIVLCMFESTTRLAGEVVADLEAFFADARETDTPWSNTRIFRSAIRRNIKLAESPSYGQTIFDYAPGSHGAEDYGALAGEFLEMLQPPEPAAQAQHAPAPPTPETPLPSEPAQAPAPASASDAPPTSSEAPPAPASPIEP